MSDLEVRLEDGALWLTWNRPEQFNALTGEMVLGAIQQLRGATPRADVRVVVLTGTGSAFSAGADLGGADAQQRYDAGSVDAANQIIRAITELDKPVVCGLNGIAAGVGMSVALACDLVVATESAALTLAFTKVGLMPDGGATATVAAAVGRARAMRLALLSDLISAREAYDAGLISHVFADEEYAEGLDTIVRRLSSGAPLAFAATKKAVNAATLGGLGDAFARERAGQSLLLRTEDVAEGMKAFAEKRRAGLPAAASPTDRSQRCASSGNGMRLTPPSLRWKRTCSAYESSTRHSASCAAQGSGSSPCCQVASEADPHRCPVGGEVPLAAVLHAAAPDGSGTPVAARLRRSARCRRATPADRAPSTRARGRPGRAARPARSRRSRVARVSRQAR